MIIIIRRNNEKQKYSVVSLILLNIKTVVLNNQIYSGTLELELINTFDS